MSSAGEGAKTLHGVTEIQAADVFNGAANLVT